MEKDLKKNVNLKKKEEEGERGPASRVALIVLGMHRSGTSALTGVLSLCGASLPKHLIPANERNPLGYFESERLYQLHDELLEEAGTSWHEPGPFPESWLSSPAAEPWVQRTVRTVLEEVGDSHFFVLKDPRLCRLLPFWRQVLAQLHAEPRYAISVRDPLETARSLEESAGVPEKTGLLLGLEYFLAAERDTRGSPRSFVLYPDLLLNWRAAIKRIGADLDLHFPRLSQRAAAEVDAFLSSRHRHQVSDPEEIFHREDIHPWVKDTYQWAREAAVGNERASEELDRVASQLREAEEALGPSLAAAEHRRAQDKEAREKLEIQLAKLEEEIAEHKNERRELREQLARRRRQARQLTETVRMLFRWVVDRVRGPDEPAPASLKATLNALAEADPAEIPGITSTGLLLSEQRIELARAEQERVARAAELAGMATRLARAEAEAAEGERQLARVSQEMSACRAEGERLRGELSGARAQVRTAAARARREAAERDRLERECARLLRKTSEISAELQHLRNDAAQAKPGS